MTNPKAPDDMHIAKAEDYPIIELVAKFMGGAASGVALHILDGVSPKARDMLLGSVTLKLALNILLSGEAEVGEDKARQMFEFYLEHVRGEMLEAEREKAGGVQ